MRASVAVMLKGHAGIAKHSLVMLLDEAGIGEEDIVALGLSQQCAANAALAAAEYD